MKVMCVSNSAPNRCSYFQSFESDVFSDLVPFKKKKKPQTKRGPDPGGRGSGRGQFMEQFRNLLAAGRPSLGCSTLCVLWESVFGESVFGRVINKSVEFSVSFQFCEDST